jgi:hypothetical protein
MISKKELVDLTIEKLNGGPVLDYRKYHPNVIGRLVDVVLNSIISDDVKRGDAQGGGGVSSEWVHRLSKLPIKLDKDREECYIEWDVEILMMENNRGIREITWKTPGNERGFNIMPSSSYQVLADLEASNPENGQLAIVEGKRVYFPQMPVVYVKNKAYLTARVVLAASSYSGDDVIPVPEERFIEAMQLIDQLALPFKSTRMKVTNDSNPNTV